MVKRQKIIAKGRVEREEAAKLRKAKAAKREDKVWKEKEAEAKAREELVRVRTEAARLEKVMRARELLDKVEKRALKVVEEVDQGDNDDAKGEATKVELKKKGPDSPPRPPPKAIKKKKAKKTKPKKATRDSKETKLVEAQGPVEPVPNPDPVKEVTVRRSTRGAKDKK